MKFQSYINPNPPAPANTITLAGIRWFPDRVQELQDRRPTQTILAPDIHHATITFGFHARHPILQFLFGSFLIAITFPFVIVLLQTGIVRLITIFGGLTTLLGLYVLYDALRRCHILILHLHHGRKKFSFGTRLEKQQIVAFIAEVRQLSPIPLDTDQP